jgi:DNA-binding MarR family transcriptional regulator/GNAT superfamily N-acetyltransferase
MSTQHLAEAVRHFNRFYTRQIGILDEHLLASEFSLTEARILYELAQRPALTTAVLCRELGLDSGYLSRVIARFEARGLVMKSRAPDDARATQLQLSAAGRAAFEPLNEASRREVTTMLGRLSAGGQQQLVDAMARIQDLLGERAASYLLRDPQPGDMGWVVHRHGALYAQEYGWNMEFEALVAEIVARYVRDHDPHSERCWIAEKNGQVAGSVFVVRHDAQTAKLRLLYVEPSARGLGIGRQLVEECLRFARLAGYRRMILWTNSVLVDARRIYEQAGFELVEEEPHRSFGKDLVGQTWSRVL